MSKFIVSPEAERDLDIIKSYPLRQAGSRVTRHIFRQLRAGMRVVAQNPAAGHVRDDLAEGWPVKFWPVFSYLIVYEPHRKPVTIARVLHGSRDVGEILSYRSGSGSGAATKD